MNLFKKTPGGKWHVSFKTRTGVQRLSTGQTDREAAEAVVLRAGIMEIEASRHVRLLANAAAQLATIGRQVSALEAYRLWVVHLEAATGSPKTVERYKWEVFRFFTAMNWPPLCEVSTATVDRWVNRTDRPLHAQTRNVTCCALNHFFKYCDNEGWARNPVANCHVKRHLLDHAHKESKARRPFSDEEFERLLAAAGDHKFWRPAILIARYTGLRWGDVESLEWDSVNIQEGRLIVWTDKRDRRADLDMPVELVPVFSELAESRNGSPTVLPRMYPSETRTDWDKLKIAAKLPNELCRHCLRHTYANALLRSGIPVKEIARRLCHFSESTTQRYIHAKAIE
jgi:integrase